MYQLYNFVLSRISIPRKTCKRVLSSVHLHVYDKTIRKLLNYNLHFDTVNTFNDTITICTERNVTFVIIIRYVYD